MPAINPALPAIAVLRTLPARACDPVRGVENGPVDEFYGTIIALVMGTF